MYFGLNIEWMFAKLVLRNGKLGVMCVVISQWGLTRPSSVFFSLGTVRDVVPLANVIPDLFSPEGSSDWLFFLEKSDDPPAPPCERPAILETKTKDISLLFFSLPVKNKMQQSIRDIGVTKKAQTQTKQAFIIYK